MDVAFLGTGLMGTPMAARLLHRGHRLTVYNRSPHKTQPLVELGARSVTRPADAIDGSDWVILMLTDAAAVEASLFDSQTRPMLHGRKILNMATIAPRQARRLAELVARDEGRYMECPVLGSTPEAKAGTLILMFGGSDAEFHVALPVLQAFGPKPLHIGAVGQASALKLAMNQLIASLTAAFSNSLAMVRKEGVAVEKFMTVVHESALHAPTFDKKLPRMLERDFANPNFPLKHLLKDVRLIKDTAADNGLDTTILSAIESLLVTGIDHGQGELDYSALYGLIYPDGAV
jgi:3-hydroxyisobutyrate dehydrogenase-like beta-hydroxyacid dehydrogenase